MLILTRSPRFALNREAGRERFRLFLASEPAYERHPRRAREREDRSGNEKGSRLWGLGPARACRPAHHGRAAVPRTRHPEDFRLPLVDKSRPAAVIAPANPRLHRG